MYRQIALTLWTIVAGIVALLPVAANAYPDKPVRIVVPQGVGGANDILGRLIAAKLAEKWKQSVIVENKAGAAGNIGALYVARAPSDGYTLLIASDGPMAINASLFKKLQFDPAKDFTPLASLASFEFVLVVNKDLPVNTLADFSALAQKRAAAQQPLAMGGVTGSTSHLAGAIIEKALKTKSTAIGYKGASELFNDLLGGRLDGVSLTISAIANHVNSGAAKAIVVTGEKRSRLMPNVPTLTESGIPMSIASWFGLFGPANMSPAIVRQINEDVTSILRDPETQKRMQALGLDVFEAPLPKFEAVMKSSIGSWGSIVRDIGLSMD